MSKAKDFLWGIGSWLVGAAGDSLRTEPEPAKTNTAPEPTGQERSSQLALPMLAPLQPHYHEAARGPYIAGGAASTSKCTGFPTSDEAETTVESGDHKQQQQQQQQQTQREKKAFKESDDNDEQAPPLMLVPTITAVAMPSSSTDRFFVVTGVDFVGTGLKSETDIGSSDTRARSDAAALLMTEATTGKIRSLATVHFRLNYRLNFDDWSLPFELLFLYSRYQFTFIIINLALLLHISRSDTDEQLLRRSDER